ncbi:MAG: solute carrier family 23 protein [Thermomicrobiales bacterium]
MILDQVMDLFSWREKRSGIIMPDERLPWGTTVTLGIQHVLAMFGSTVIAPVLMGFDPNLAILFSGIGTLIFFAFTLGKVPSYLGSSFAFIAPVLAVTAGGGSMKQALGGIVVAGLIYLLIGVAVELSGSGWIDALMPPLVTGAVVTIIGLNLASAAKGMAQSSMPLAIVTILAVMAIAIAGKGLIGRLPILLGTVFGYLVALILGGTTEAGRSIGPMHFSGVDFQPVKDAAWIGWPDFAAPSFNWHAISLIAPVAIVLVAENTGHIKAVSEMTGRNLMPFLGRGFIGDGAATMVAGFGGGTGVTTYAENIGVMAVTKVFSTAMFVVAACTAILLGFVPKFGALIGSIPQGVLGGVSTVLFGLIAVTGVRIWVENQVDFSKSANLFIAAVTIIIGAADFTLQLGDFAFAGIGLGTFGAIILYQVFKALGYTDAVLTADAEPEVYSERRTSGSRGGRGGAGGGWAASLGRRGGSQPARGGRQRVAAPVEDDEFWERDEADDFDDDFGYEVDPRTRTEASSQQRAPSQPRRTGTQGRRPAQGQSSRASAQRPSQRQAPVEPVEEVMEDWEFEEVGLPEPHPPARQQPSAQRRPASGQAQPRRQRPLTGQERALLESQGLLPKDDER